MTCLRATWLARGRAHIQIQATCLPLQHSQSSTICVCISSDEKQYPESSLLLFRVPLSPKVFFILRFWKSLPVFCSCLPVQRHLFAQYLKGLNSFFQRVEGLVLGESPDSMLWEQTTLWRGLSPTNSTYLPAPVGVGRITVPRGNPIRDLNQNHPGKLLWICDSQNGWETVNDHCCFKPLSFRLICYAVFDNKSTMD